MMDKIKREIRKFLFMRQKAEADLKRLYSEVVLVTVAFNNVSVIDWQIKLIRKFWPEALHIIADNSSDSAVADKIKQISGGAPYILKCPTIHLRYQSPMGQH